MTVSIAAASAGPGPRVRLRLHGAWPGVLTGLAILGAGFGTVCLFWALGHWQRGVPGFWDYRSATIGDGLLLPTGAGLFVSLGARLPPAPAERRTLAIAYALGAASGLLVQALWLHDPHPQLNWTVPAPHTFNTPGWYHAGFFVVVSGFFTRWIVRVVWRARAARRSDPAAVLALCRSPELALGLACLIGFTGLVVIDGIYIEGHATPLTWTSLSATVAALLSVTVGCGLFAWSLGWDVIADCWRTFVWAAVLDIALWTAAVSPTSPRSRSSPRELPSSS